MEAKLRKEIESDPKLQNQYEFLLNKKKLADEALEEFLKKVKDERCVGDDDNDDNDDDGRDDGGFFKADPTLIVDYNVAVEFIEKNVLSNQKKTTEIKKYIKQQDDMEKVWEIVHKRLLSNPHMDEDGLNLFYNECMIQLEEFSKKCHQKFALMKIPLFCLAKEYHYKNLSKDRRSLISFIQQQVMKS